MNASALLKTETSATRKRRGGEDWDCGSRPKGVPRTVWRPFPVPPPFGTSPSSSSHPGEVLLEEFMKPLDITQYRLSKDVGTHPRRINQIVHGKRSISADTALRLARYFGTSERFWLNLQVRYDLEVEKERLGDRLDTEVRALVPGSLPSS